MAKFLAKDVVVKAKLSNGNTIKCTTWLIADGWYYESQEGFEYYTWFESHFDVYDETARPFDPEYFETDIKTDAQIIEILQILSDPYWEVQDGWEDDKVA